MAILVTGGCGYIGSHTVLELLAAGRDVVIIDSLVNSKRAVIGRVERIAGRKVMFYMADIRDREALDRVFIDNDIDCVVHFAGLKAVGESVYKPLEYYDNNVGGTISLLNAMSAYEIKRIVFSSSATVYSGDNEMPLNENTSKTGDCGSPYGATKFIQERILTDCANANPALSVMLLRYFNPIGAHESGDIGNDPGGVPNNLLPYITQVAIGRLDILEVYGDDYPTADGACIRDYIHVVDLAKGHVAAIDWCEKHKGPRAVNLGSGVGTSVFELISAFEAATGVSIPKRVAPRRAGDFPETYADPAVAKEIFGWRTEKSIADMCRDEWRWQQKNPRGYVE